MSITNIKAFTNGMYHLVRKGYDTRMNIRCMGILLAVYSREEPYTVRELSEFFDINKPSVTRSLDDLSGENLIERLADPQDKRSVLIGRTESGDAFLEMFKEVLKGHSEVDVLLEEELTGV